MDRRFSFWIDRGGTFTDVIATAEDGEVITLKLLSSSPAYPDAAVEAMRRVLDAPRPLPFPAHRVSAIRMGRMSEIPDNDPAFGSDAESIIRDWCRRSGIAFAGAANIGHDAANRVVPFNLARN